METLIWKSSFEALDEGLLNRLARVNVVEFDAIAVGPGVHLFGQELLGPTTVQWTDDG